MMALFNCFDEQSSPIIGEDVLVDSNGNIFNLPDLSAAVEETLKKPATMHQLHTIVKKQIKIIKKT